MAKNRKNDLFGSCKIIGAGEKNIFSEFKKINLWVYLRTLFAKNPISKLVFRIGANYTLTKNTNTYHLILLFSIILLYLIISDKKYDTK